MGDARLSLERQLANHEVQNFDVLSVDAFSSDAIPIHLLTREALGLYFKHLKPDGILALHISNRYLDLAPVCAAGAEYFHKEARTVSDDGEGGSYLSSSTWVLVTSHPEWFEQLRLLRRGYQRRQSPASGPGPTITVISSRFCAGTDSATSILRRRPVEKVDDEHVDLYLRFLQFQAELFSKSSEYAWTVFVQ